MRNRFEKLGADGAPANDPVEIMTARDVTTGLEWTVDNIGSKGMTWDAAKKACAALTIGGHNDWRLPTVEELFALADRSRFKPAIDVDVFPTTKSDWYWSSSPVASAPEDYAWLVLFHYGDSYYHLQYYTAFVRAVRSSSPASQ